MGDSFTWDGKTPLVLLTGWTKSQLCKYRFAAFCHLGVTWDRCWVHVWPLPVAAITPSPPCHCGLQKWTGALLHHVIPLCFSLARNIRFQSLKMSMANPSFAHVTKSLVLVQMVLIALSMPQEWMEKARLTLGEGSEAALQLYWRYFDSHAPSCCCTWKSKGAGSICLCVNWTELLLCVCRNNVPCNCYPSLSFPALREVERYREVL